MLDRAGIAERGKGADASRVDIGAVIGARGAKLQKANLSGAKLQRADLRSQNLRGAILSNAYLQDANMHKADLRGANFGGAYLQVANLLRADLRGANFGGAKVQGAYLDDTKLQGANMYRADLRGAILKGAELQAADLSGADLRGASLVGVQLQGADLRGAKIWQTLAPSDPRSQTPGPLGMADLEIVPLTSESKAALIIELKSQVTDRELLTKVMGRLEDILNDPPQREDGARWLRYISEAKDPPPDELANDLAGLLCQVPEIARGIATRAIRYSWTPDRTHYAKPLARALLDTKCATEALTAHTRARLQEIVSAPE